MIKKEKILSLLVALLMVVAAAITVNKSVAGPEIVSHEKEKITGMEGDEIITALTDGNFIIHTSGLQGTATGYAGPVPVDI